MASLCCRPDKPVTSKTHYGAHRLVNISNVEDCQTLAFAYEARASGILGIEQRDDNHKAY